MKTLECKNRKAFSISIEKIMVIAIAIVAVGVLAAFGGDLIGTASVVETMDLSKQSLYAEQEFVTVTIKNSGTTAIKGIQAYVLIADATAAVLTSNADCTIGGEKALISTDVNQLGILLNPGESVTISGDLYTAGTYDANGDVTLAVLSLYLSRRLWSLLLL
jgi:ethanolamine utilization microcompartment shell protein EutS